MMLIRVKNMILLGQYQMLADERYLSGKDVLHIVDTASDDADNCEKNDYYPLNMESDDAAKSEKGSLL